MLDHLYRFIARWSARWLLFAFFACTGDAIAVPPLTLRFESLGVEQGLTQESVRPCCKTGAAISGWVPRRV